MTEPELIEMAYRAVAADLNNMLYDRPEITAAVASGSETRFVHAWIRSTVEDLFARVVERASDEGIDLSDLELTAR